MRTTANQPTGPDEPVDTTRPDGQHPALPPALVRVSKFLSLVLRHRPERIGLTLDAQGWADVEDLIARANRAGVALSRPVLEEVIAGNDKRRFALSDDGSRIRASQGHSIPVDLGLPVVEPPEVLYHGTTTRHLDAIRRTGLSAQRRNHVHLSGTVETARAVGARHGPPVVLTVAAGRMARDGHAFHRSANGVWLIAAVPPEYLS